MPGLSWITPALKAAAGVNPRDRMTELWRLLAVPGPAQLRAEAVTLHEDAQAKAAKRARPYTMVEQRNETLFSAGLSATATKPALRSALPLDEPLSAWHHLPGRRARHPDRPRRQGGARAERRDKLLIATGSAPFIIPVEGRDLKGEVTYRDLDDTNAMIEASAKGGKAVVMGGGLHERGREVTALHLLERQLDPATGDLPRKDLEARGIEVVTKVAAAAPLGKDRVERVLVQDNTGLVADLVFKAVGIHPEIRLANAPVSRRSRHRGGCADADIGPGRAGRG
ncbi:FAD-dependent oxidoreductase [Maliponia aquimaris]|uniref:Nitrite reductase [NAD(P)H] n=1 Tax=Maliponia aquimaris TaxID=1673631 RepID=A0A238K7J4_9RHOB|nr:Nitrite reductase [NAD(P)H] [Maliponia aquimaris]